MRRRDFITFGLNLSTAKGPGLTVKREFLLVAD
jgi:hypothetical protein